MPQTPEQKAQLVDEAAVILRSAARDGAAIAINADPRNADYVKLTVATLNTFILGADYTPGALSKALAAVVVQTADIRIKLAIDTVVDLYELFFGRYVKGEIAAHASAAKLLAGIRDGAAQTLAINPVQRKAMLKR